MKDHYNHIVELGGAVYSGKHFFASDEKSTRTKYEVGAKTRLQVVA
jgi:hypothetical protein